MKADRMNPYAAAPEAFKPLVAIEEYLGNAGLEHALVELVKIRASQINGCAFCLGMHTRDARSSGETEQRIYLLNAWREASCYTDRERAGLAWTESLTDVSRNHVPDVVYDQARTHFSETELANLTLLVTQINTWNRFAIAFRYHHD